MTPTERLTLTCCELPIEHYEALDRMADKQDRSLAAEIRLAIARHIEEVAK